MIDTHIYDYDTYSRDTEMSTYLCAELVMSDIDAYLRDRSNLALDSDMVFPRLLERNLHLAAENKVLSTVLDSYNWIDIDTKSIRGLMLRLCEISLDRRFLMTFFRQM